MADDIGFLHGCPSPLVSLLFAGSLQIGLEKVLDLIEGDDLQIVVQIRMHGARDDHQLLVLRVRVPSIMWA